MNSWLLLHCSLNENRPFGLTWTAQHLAHTGAQQGLPTSGCVAQGCSQCRGQLSGEQPREPHPYFSWHISAGQPAPAKGTSTIGAASGVWSWQKPLEHFLKFKIAQLCWAGEEWNKDCFITWVNAKPPSSRWPRRSDLHSQGWGKQSALP